MHIGKILKNSFGFTVLIFTLGCGDSVQLGDKVIGDEFADNATHQSMMTTDSSNGKGDQLSRADRSRYASCNEGSFLIERIGEEYVAVITDSGVINYFLSQSDMTFQTTVEYSGQSNTVTIQKELPWMVAVENIEGASQQLVIRDFRLDEMTGSLSTSGPPGNSISPIGGGLKLVINGSAMTNSHTVTYYEVGNWFFESCDIEEAPQEITSSVELVADCNDGALVLERSEEDDSKIVATVTDETAVEYFLTQSTSTQCEEISYSGEMRNVCVQKKFHYSTTVTEEGTLILDGLQASGDDFIVSGRDGASLFREEDGLRLTLRGSEMTSSHSVSYYEIGDWLFDTCNWY